MAKKKAKKVVKKAKKVAKKKGKREFSELTKPSIERLAVLFFMLL